MKRHGNIIHRYIFHGVKKSAQLKPWMLPLRRMPFEPPAALLPIKDVPSTPGIPLSKSSTPHTFFHLPWNETRRQKIIATLNATTETHRHGSVSFSSWLFGGSFLLLSLCPEDPIPDPPHRPGVAKKAIAMYGSKTITRLS